VRRKGLGVCASVGNTVWKVALESAFGCGPKCDVRPLSRPTAGGRRAAGSGLGGCGIGGLWNSGGLQLRAGSVGTDGRLRRRRIETELICWWSVESVKRCEAWEEMKEEKSDSPVDEGATRTDNPFLGRLCPCVRLPELTNEKKNENASGTRDGGGKSKMQPAKRTERSPSQDKTRADDARGRDQSDGRATRRSNRRAAPTQAQCSAARRTGFEMRGSWRGEGPGPSPLPVLACASQKPNGCLGALLTHTQYSHDKYRKAHHSCNQFN
jgi:hypothetical protein